MKTPTTLRQKVLAVLSQSSQPMSYRELTDAIWQAFPEFKTHMLSLYDTDLWARRELRMRMGIMIKESPGVFELNKVAGKVLVGLGNAPAAEPKATPAQAPCQSAPC